MGEQGAWTRRALRFHVLPGPLSFPPADPSPPATSPWPPSWWWTLQAFRTPGTRAKTGPPPSRSCATITLMSACSCFSTSGPLSRRCSDSGRYGWAGLGLLGTHPAFSFMLSGPALIKTQTPGLTARASAPPPSPSVSHGLFSSELGAPQALLPQLTLVWAEQFLFTHTPELNRSPAIRLHPSCPAMGENRGFCTVSGS